MIIGMMGMGQNVLILRLSDSLSLLSLLNPYCSNQMSRFPV
jgi:hypothetical protein